MKTAEKSVILLVDDKPANILALENVLAGEQRILLTAANGEDALRIALQQDIDLILLDVQMPGMDGFEVAQTLKSNRRTKNIPIIFATAESKDRKFMMKGFGEGAIDYLFKPLDPDIVNAKVDVLLRIQLQQKELLEKNASLEKSALLINNSADILCILDAGSFVTEECNNAVTEILGYTREQFSGKSLADYLDEPGKLLLQTASIEEGKRLLFETAITCADGSQKWLQWHVTVSRGKWYASARDITAVKEADAIIRDLNAKLQDKIQQLEVSNKELESFSYSVSHDLRSPLRAMNGYATIISEDYGQELSEGAKKALGHIQANAGKMGNLIDDLLAFSRLGRKEIQHLPVNMNLLVEQALGDTEKKGISFVQQNLLSASGDQALLQQVWVNLISNAVKYSSRKKDPVVEIGSFPGDGNRVVYYVKDNGAGFDMKYASKLFGVFQRLHNPRDFEGTGVGLAIAQRIVTRHGGTIWADAAVNEGACFYFSIPGKESD